ncbi:MAG TPA: hypothetical protein QGG70_03115 [Candidatus Pacearchaeota archaeon]|jgi:ABC-type lipoprotein release transport system permease subunit|nr:hypothetical protein [Candidatus Pacearchaeota archaeon]
MYNKKAQSQIITTILIILLVLAAIIIVWQVIQGTVQEGADEIESQSSCLGLRLEITDIAVTGTDLASITIRPTKNISGYQAYVNGAAFGAAGVSVDALATKTIDPKTDDPIIESEDEIEVIAIIDGAPCPGVKREAP